MAIWPHVTPTPSDRFGPLPPHATPRRRRRGTLRYLERLLVVFGLMCLGYYGYVTAESALYQAYETRELDAILASAPPAAAPVAAAGRERPPLTRTRASERAVLGRLEIPRLGVSAVVRSGSDARTLRLAIGHIAGTALPGEEGNIGLAAHRDTFFRRLGEIRADDEVRFVTADGTFIYRVDGSRVVEPRDVWVLDPTDRPALTLVTCYPFRYVGSAPQRFIVRARLVGQ